MGWYVSGRIFQGPDQQYSGGHMYHKLTLLSCTSTEAMISSGSPILPSAVMLQLSGRHCLVLAECKGDEKCDILCICIQPCCDCIMPFIQMSSTCSHRPIWIASCMIVRNLAVCRGQHGSSRKN